MLVSPLADKENEFERLAAAVRKKAAARVRKAERLIKNLHSDLEKHGEPSHWKRFGELLLANPNAPRDGATVRVTDYFSENTPIVEIQGDANLSVSEIAEGYFRLYVKARNGKT